MNPTSPMAPTSVADRVRAAISELHTAIEALPFAQALARGQVEAEAYRELLWQLRAFHVWLESEAMISECVAQIWAPEMARAIDLDRDLDFFRHRSGAENFDLWEATQTAVADLSAGAKRASQEILGALYVSEGSRMGGRIVGQRLADSWGVAPKLGVGLDYQLAGLAQGSVLLPELRSRLNEVVGTEDVGVVESGARRAMQAFHSIFAAASERMHEGASRG